MSLLTTFFALVSVVQGFSVTTPSGWTNNQNTTIAWSSVSSDPQQFSVELVNPTLLNNHPYAIATTLNKSDGPYSFLLPLVPAGDGYTLQFVNVSNIDDVYATSSSFSIANGTVPSTTSSGSVSTESATTGTTSGTATGSASTSSAPSTTSTHTGSANKVGPTVALAVVLAVIGFSTLGF